MTKAPTPTENSKKQRDNIKNATKTIDYTTIADRLRTVSWSNSSHPTGVGKPGLRALNLERTALEQWLEFDMKRELWNVSYKYIV